MEEPKKKVKKKPSFKVVAIEFNNTPEAGNKKTPGELKRVAEELQKHMRNFRYWGYSVRIEEYPQGLLIVGEREQSAREALPIFLSSLLRRGAQTPDPMSLELMHVDPEHINTINRVLIGMDQVPAAELPTALPRLVADVTRGMPGDRLREIIAAGEKVAEAHEKHRPDPDCTLLVRVRQVVDTLKKQVQLQTS